MTLFSISFLFLILTFYVYAETPHECCVARNVSTKCTAALCNPSSPPDDMRRYTVFEKPDMCYKYLPEITACLTAGRDSTDCCQRKAMRSDVDKCLNMCGGSVKESVSSWRQFKSCFVVNVDSIYQCFATSYSTHPSQPLHLRIVSQKTNIIHLNWSPPEHNADLVHIYKVHLVETSGRTHQEVIHDTKQLELKINNLKNNGKYTVFVVAHAKDLKSKSLASDEVHFNTMTSAENAVFVDELKIPKESTKATLACHVRQGVNSRKFVVWEKKDRSTLRKVVPQGRFKITTYSAEIEDLLYFVSSLEIDGLVESDFGLYRCHLDGEINDYGEVKLTMHSWSESSMPPSPPETPLECCSKTTTSAGCQSICTETSGYSKTDVKPGAFLPQLKCIPEMHNLFKCTLQSMNNVGCCIRKRIPYYCLGMCDSRFMMGSLLFSDCMSYVNKVYSCQSEKINKLPDVVDGVTAKTEGGETTISWKPTEDTEIYHIYYRVNKNEWHSKSTTTTSFLVPRATEIVIMAVNKFGQSGPYRMEMGGADWLHN